MRRFRLIGFFDFCWLVWSIISIGFDLLGCFEGRRFWRVCLRRIGRGFGRRIGRR